MYGRRRSLGEGRRLDEADLIARARAGEPAAYADLVAPHRPAALRVAALLLGDQTEAEDAVQEASVKAYAALTRFRDGAPFRPWLLQIVANEARNRRRAAGRRADLARRAGDAQRALDEAAPSPEAAVLAAEQRAVLARALGDLREEDRQVIAARYFLELSEAETAAALAWPRGTVKSRLSRALGRLRSGLAVGLLLLLALLAALAASSAEVRRAVADRLGLRGIEIVHTPFGPAPTATPVEGAGAIRAAAGPVATEEPARRPGPTSPEVPAVGLDLGVRLSLAEAAARFDAPILRPAGLGEPDAVYLREPPAGGMVSLVYLDGAGRPPAGAAGVALLITQFRGALAPEFIGKGLGPGTRVEAVAVGPGAGVGRALWIEGDPHFFFYRDRTGRIADESVRLAGNVLLWERGELTLRLEGASSRERALAVAASVD